MRRTLSPFGWTAAWIFCAGVLLVTAWLLPTVPQAPVTSEQERMFGPSAPVKFLDSEWQEYSEGAIVAFDTVGQEEVHPLMNVMGSP